MKLIIQIPCLNEEESLPQTLHDLPKQIEGVDQIEILVIDDGSTDRTSEVARQNGVDHIVRLTKRKGLAYVFHSGLDASLKKGADIIVNTDADGQYKGTDIPRLVQPIVQGKADIVIGNRNIEHVKQFSWLKKKLQRIGSSVVRMLSGSDIPDATTGFRAYSREAALRINIISEYTYTLESIIQAGHKNLAIENITVDTNRVTRPSRLFKSISEYIKRSVVTMVRVWAMFNPLRLFMNLGIISLCIGVVISSRFLLAFMMYCYAGKIQKLILAAIFLIVGFQLLIIGLVTDLISANRRLIEDVLLRVKKIELRQRRIDK
jgi:glycosyltransferase involved in cell wall biosynthesis